MGTNGCQSTAETNRAASYRRSALPAAPAPCSVRFDASQIYRDLVTELSHFLGSIREGWMLMNRFLWVGLGFVMISAPARAQTAGATPPNPAVALDHALATRQGQELDVSLGGYTYTEPGDQSISIHGFKFGGDYTGTLSLSERGLWFVQANVRGTIGSVTYDGWCSPWLITPNRASPNGYALDVGDASPCSESGDRDWYVEARGLVGKDLIGRAWGFAPFSGLGLRHLSNGTNGVNGYRTDNYLYLPFGATARTRVASQNTLGFSLEYDRLLHGWQTTRDSQLGGGFVPATTTAPSFTIDGFSDVSFNQQSGWALRASAKYQFAEHWTIEPYYVHWSVTASPANSETATFTVNGVTAQQQLGFYEPDNVTNEFAVRIGIRF
jgi:hypothetical protein